MLSCLGRKAFWRGQILKKGRLGLWVLYSLEWLQWLFSQYFYSWVCRKCSRQFTSVTWRYKGLPGDLISGIAEELLSAKSFVICKRGLMNFEWKLKFNKLKLRFRLINCYSSIPETLLDSQTLKCLDTSTVCFHRSDSLVQVIPYGLKVTYCPLWKQ